MNAAHHLWPARREVEGERRAPVLRHEIRRRDPGGGDESVEIADMIGEAIGDVRLARQAEPDQVRRDAARHRRDVRENVAPDEGRGRVAMQEEGDRGGRGAAPYRRAGGRFPTFSVTAQVGDLVQNRRREFARDVGSPVRASMMAQPCFSAVDKNERMSAKSMARSIEWNPPEIFWRNFIMRPSRSA